MRTVSGIANHGLCDQQCDRRRALHDCEPRDVLCYYRSGLCDGDGAEWSPARSALIATLLHALTKAETIVVHCATKAPRVETALKGVERATAFCQSSSTSGG